MAEQEQAKKADDNLEAGTLPTATWSLGKASGPLNQLLAYVEAQADESIKWYWRNKAWKARLSRTIQISAIILTALAGLFPILAYLGKDLKWPAVIESGLWPSLFVGIAAALLGIDRAFGISSGWTRYVLTATSIRKLLEEFRLDCAVMLSKSGQDAPDQLSLVQRAKDFRLAVENAVLQETKDWATEFQNNVAQLEKDVKAQLDSLKGELEKAKQQDQAKEPGALDLTIANAEAADGGVVQVILDGLNGKIAEETLTGANKWVRLGLAPGQYRVSLKAKVKGFGSYDIERGFD